MALGESGAGLLLLGAVLGDRTRRRTVACLCADTAYDLALECTPATAIALAVTIDSSRLLWCGICSAATTGSFSVDRDLNASERARDGAVRGGVLDDALEL
jgi:hypothetical protein